MKITRRQLRRMILNETRILLEATSEANGEVMTLLMGHKVGQLLVGAYAISPELREKLNTAYEAAKSKAQEKGGDTKKAFLAYIETQQDDFRPIINAAKQAASSATTVAKKIHDPLGWYEKGYKKIKGLKDLF